MLRAAAAFRVSELMWVDDINDESKRRKVRLMIDYALSPPYSKRYFPLTPDLSNAALMDPIQVPTHPDRAVPVEGEVRLGVKSGNRVDFGVGKRFKKEPGLYVVTDSLRLKFRPVKDLVYLGPRVKFLKFQELIKLPGLVLGSRSCGNPLLDSDRLVEIFEREGLTLFLGPPQGGLLKESGWRGLCYNFLPEQGVKDVRTEEALWASLSILNVILQ
ncbi:hypothetical protein HS1genome_0282 [Sulfodiicoccus acidiphilus]|uniref:Uncharacterized protein n=1 Tax=Sulfodiicoccus acidiphilus TaxID=1670455 RepID=A0A348B141_9CREN|nr:hypothetical protein HS1genome_0282 [Sulfodiicoccus acidiphilus]GGT91259.1 hypothetical protein GCM10007116_06220 [Sulfodiicoccus acidiphilus]